MDMRKIKIKKSHVFKMLLVFLLAQAGMAYAMTALEDNDLSEVTGQALFVSDKIAPTGAAGSTTDFTFYRMGLDVQLDLNMNIDRMRLGCGGTNNAIDASVCDIDMEYVRLMGRCTTAGCGQTSPDGQAIPGAGAPLSDFILKRPYIELAVKNDSAAAQREVVGVKIGAQSADGFFSVGQVKGRGNNPANHSGINAISGYMNIELSLVMNATLRSALGIPTTSTMCSGNESCSNTVKPYYRSVTGTRMTDIRLAGLEMTPNGGLAGILGDTAYADFRENLKFIHGFQLQNTSDFFLSFQRQQVSYPKYNKQGYAVTANTGWWMNVPDVKMTGLRPPDIDMACGFLWTACLSAFSTPGVVISNIELNSSPAQNCYGSSLFC